MTKLLVSVRDVTEARIALDAGVDLIDIKEPRRGALGKADHKVIDDISQLVNQRRPLSAALGELSEYTADDLAQLSMPSSIQFAKVGLASCSDDLSWPRRLAMLWERLPSTVGRVAVIYADWQTAAAPPPQEVLDHAANLKCSGVLIDTLLKSSLKLTTLWEPAQLREIMSAAQKLKLMTVLAGQVSPDDVAQLLLYRPDYIAVRGAVCHPDRNGIVEAARICSFRKLLAANLELASLM